MNKFQEKFYKNWSDLRDELLSPIVFLLSKLKIKPNHVTLAGVFSMLAFVFFIPNRTSLSILFIILSVFFDMLDGALARYQKVSSDKGKFIDVCADCINFFLFLAGLSLINLIPPFVLLSLGFLMLLSRVFRILLNSFNYKSDWLFRPVAGFLPNLFGLVAYLLFIISTVFDSYIIMNQLFLLFTIILIIDSGYNFSKILSNE